MTYCHISNQIDQYLNAQDANDAEYEAVAEAVIEDYGWPRLEELAKALNLDTDEITEQLIEHRRTSS